MSSVLYSQAEYTLPLDWGIRSQNCSGYDNKERKKKLTHMPGLNTGCSANYCTTQHNFLEKTTVTQTAEKCLAFYGNQRFITVLPTVHKTLFSSFFTVNNTVSSSGYTVLNSMMIVNTELKSMRDFTRPNFSTCHFSTSRRD
jgi:hypothetical protein